MAHSISDKNMQFTYLDMEILICCLWIRQCVVLQLITVLGNEYVILDIFLRMLTPEELKLGQGFPRDYIIDRDYKGNKYPVSKQVARIGNSVVPVMAQKLVECNCGYLKAGERMPNMRIDYSGGQLRFA